MYVTALSADDPLPEEDAPLAMRHGMTSSQAVRLRDILNDALWIDCARPEIRTRDQLPGTLAFDHPSIGEIVAFATEATGVDAFVAAAAAKGPPTSAPAPARAPASSTPRRASSGGWLVEQRRAEARAFIAQCAAALMKCQKGKAALYCGGDALLSEDVAEGGALRLCGEIARVSGAAFLCENAFARVDRGGGLPCPTRLPYFPQDAARALSAYELVVTMDARRPIAMFGYDGAGPSHLIRLHDDAVWDLDVGDSVCVTAQMLLDEVRALAKRGGGRDPAPNVSQDFSPISPPSPPTHDGPLTASAMCHIVAALQPKDCVVVDESLTSGASYWDHSATCERFSHLTLTGGAIGFGPAAAVGAAVACPGRKIINIQADGSGLYSAQALWTQAKERLDVVTVVCANRKYAILKLEHAMQRVGAPGKASKARSTVLYPNVFHPPPGFNI